MTEDHDPGNDHGARVAYKDLCIDVTDLDAGAEFLGPLLGLGVEERRDAILRLGDGVAEHTVWLNLVAEPHSVKNRVHLDVDVASVDDVLAAGASVYDDRFAWTVMTQEQAGEFCAFVRTPERLHPYRVYELIVDTNDLEPIAAWWAARFGVEVHHDGENVWVEGGDGPPWALVFEPVGEPKTVKNRLHWDVYGSTGDLLAVGATLMRARDDEINWDVLADPQGNEFCVFGRP